MSIQRTGWWMAGMVLGCLVTTARAEPAPSEPPAEPATANAPTNNATTTSATAATARAHVIPERDDDTPPVRSALPTVLATAAPMLVSPYAEDPPAHKDPLWSGRRLSLLLRAAIDLGGDELATGMTTTGDSFSITAGNGATLAGGFLITPDAPVAVEVTLGYKIDGQNFSNGTISFSRVPLDAIVSFTPGNHRIGIGGTAHFSPGFDCNVTGACAGHVELDTSLGLLLQWAYTYGHLDFGLRATFISYQAKSDTAPVSASINGDSLGVFAGARL